MRRKVSVTRPASAFVHSSRPCMGLYDCMIPPHASFALLLLLSMRCARFQLDCARLDDWSAAGGQLLFATTVITRTGSASGAAVAYVV